MKRFKALIALVPILVVLCFAALSWKPQTLQAQGGQGEVWGCLLSGVGAIDTLCQQAPPPGMSLWITDIVVGSSTATAGQFTVTSGTATDCSSTAVLLPTLGYQANTGAPTVIQFATAVRVPAGRVLCTLGTAVNTANGRINGVFKPF